MGVVGVEKVGSHFQASSSGTLVKPGNELRGGEAGLAGHGHVSASVLNKVWCESRARCPKPMMPQAMELYCDDELLPSSGVTLKECGIVDGSTVVVLYHSSDAVHYKDRPLDEHAAAGGDGSQGAAGGDAEEDNDEYAEEDDEEEASSSESCSGDSAPGQECARMDREYLDSPVQIDPTTTLKKMKHTPDAMCGAAYTPAWRSWGWGSSGSWQRADSSCDDGSWHESGSSGSWQAAPRSWDWGSTSRWKDAWGGRDGWAYSGSESEF